jgi:hypothetical protein
VLSHLPLRPGRYMVQVAASSDGHTGSVFADVEVPDFSKERFSASGLLLQRTPPGGSAGKPTAAEFVPIVPTTVRAWSNADRVTAFVRLYQGGKDPIVPVLFSARVTDARNTVLGNEEGRMDAGAFDVRTAEYRFEVPITWLPPGEYLLTIEASAGTRRIKRWSRFTIVAKGS